MKTEVCALKHHKNLIKLLYVITKALVLGLRAEEILSTIYPAITYAGKVSQNIEDINIALQFLMLGRSHPNLVNACSISNHIHRH